MKHGHNLRDQIVEAIDRSRQILAEVEITQARVRETLRRSYELDRRRWSCGNA